MIKTFLSCVALLSCLFVSNNVHAQQATNPIIFADVPDMSMIRVGDTYYMSSTTMHMSPGVPIMKSTDLVNWKLINYATILWQTMPTLNLTKAKTFMARVHGQAVCAFIRVRIMYPLLHMTHQVKPISLKQKILKKDIGKSFF